MINFTPASIGAIVVASAAVLLGIFQSVMSIRLEQESSNRLGLAASIVVFFHSTSVFLQYNLDDPGLNLIFEKIQMSGFVILIYICYWLTLHYLNLKPAVLSKITGMVTIVLLGLIWFSDLIYAGEMVQRNFLWLTQPYVEPSPTFWGELIWIYIFFFGLHIFRLWFVKRKTAGVKGKLFIFGFGVLFLFCAHDLACALGFNSILYLNIYGFFIFLVCIVGITSIKYIHLYDRVKVATQSLKKAKSELELKVKHRTRELEIGNQKLQAAVDRLEESEKRISILSTQTEQFSRAAASMLLIEKEQDFFNTVSDVIVQHSDYQRVLISLFKDTPPFRDIIGFGGLDPDVIERLRHVEMPASQYDHVFETGIRIGNQSFYIPHTMKEILKQEATVYGESQVPDTENAWHPEDNLFVKMINEKGEFIGVISVDDSKSGMKPTDETVRPLEIFSSLISQIIVLKKEQKKSIALEEQLMAARKMESIGRLAGGIAHDFNNILSVIIGHSELILDQLSESDDIFPEIKSIQFAGNKATGIVNQLLSFSKNTNVHLKPLQIGPVLDDLMRLIKSTIPATIRIETDFKNNEAVIMADPVQLNQVFLNLCLNAAQSMDRQNGSIRLSSQAVCIDKSNHDQYPELNSGPHLALSVADDGPGIEPEILDKIFDPYFTTKEVGEGSGIGLAVVHGIVKTHKGIVSVYSKKGQGSKFDILFPEVEDEPEAVSKETGGIPLGNQEHVLLVDDDILIIEIIGKIIKQLQYKVSSFTRPAAALEMFRENPDQFDLMVTDMTMPNMSGLTLAENISKINPQMPVIICTGYNDVLNGKTAEDLNVSALLQKPARLDTLAREIRKAIDDSMGKE